MIISFFEEFPTKRNLEKLKLVKWPTKLYLAASSLSKFNRVKKSIKNKYVKEIIYWPTLSKREGYWISPFSKRNALKRIFNELQGKNVPIMIDAELPTTQNPWLYWTQWFNFFQNRSLIRRFVKKRKNVYVAEYYPQGGWKDTLMKFLGLHFPPTKYNCKIIKMMYHSMHNFNKEFVVNMLQEGKRMYGENFLVSYGTIAKGMTGREPLLSTKQLQEDLKITRKIGIPEIVMFRLGGLNKKYVKVMKRFTKP